MNSEKESAKVVFITGASCGIGKSTAAHLAARGYVVYGTSRHPESCSETKNVTLIKMDVRDTDSVKEAVAHIAAKEGHLDVLINNAGFGIGGAIEDTPTQMVQALFDTNFFGVYRVLQEVLPIMKQQTNGLIINMSSIGGMIGLPYQGIYSASKFAVEGLSEALYKELSSTGINVVLVEPGDFKTGFTANRQNINTKNGANAFQRSLDVIERDEQRGQHPIKIARLIEKIITASRPRLRYAVGPFDQTSVLFLKRILPDRWFDRIIMSYYKLRTAE
ncbi:MAG: SDR family NAD(P)-dependent oxidoreductase [Desulfobacterium sp.]|nr:SDR family NAD(P)-dependent oxidoreductase [Desulfobacterium sp.]